MQFPSLYTRPTGTNAIAPRKSISSAVGRWKENIAPPFSPPIPIIPRLFSLCPAFPPGLYEVVPRSKLSKVFYSIGWKRESFFWFKSFPFTAKFSIPFGAMSFFLFFFFLRLLAKDILFPSICDSYSVNGEIPEEGNFAATIEMERRNGVYIRLSNLICLFRNRETNYFDRSSKREMASSFLVELYAASSTFLSTINAIDAGSIDGRDRKRERRERFRNLVSVFTVARQLFPSFLSRGKKEKSKRNHEAKKLDLSR